ncbi:MAG: hypothetical protein EBX40_02290, partial [Gammaproteobacteria bacterium]|nr:hypothetical protein [Gammaproteobacteria bacterium]
LTENHIKVRSPGQGLSPQRYKALIGRTLSHAMAEEDFFYPSDLEDQRIEPRSYIFSRPWGVPVRYHDFREYAARINPNLWEFHLSYSDMELNPAEYLDGPYSSSLVVHAPELFAGSRLMDLASPDQKYRNESIQETQRVVNITRDLNKYFPNTLRPPIVANIGGFTMDEPLPAGVIGEYYERFAQSLSELDLHGVELIPQTMAPFPWHFGGQRYQNLFVKSNMSGEFTVVNPYLVKALKAHGLWDQVMVNDLKYFDGSVKGVNRIPPELKRLFATAFEIDASWLIEAASRRQKWIDQAQSLNLYLAKPSGKMMDHLYKLAWRLGLKTTYYFRTLGATGAEKSTLAASTHNAVKIEDEAPLACSVLDPNCEACQ